MTHLLRISIAAVLLSGFSISAVQSRPLIHFHYGKQQTQNTEAEQLFRSALTLYREGKYDEALALCTKASSLDATTIDRGHLPVTSTQHRGNSKVHPRRSPRLSVWTQK
jgi:hypothetical protein